MTGITLVLYLWYTDRWQTGIIDRCHVNNVSVTCQRVADHYILCPNVLFTDWHCISDDLTVDCTSDTVPITTITPPDMLRDDSLTVYFRPINIWSWLCGVDVSAIQAWEHSCVSDRVTQSRSVLLAPRPSDTQASVDASTCVTGHRYSSSVAIVCEWMAVYWWQPTIYRHRVVSSFTTSPFQHCVWLPRCRWCMQTVCLTGWFGLA